eukprot:TRINITY_DN16131_c0_g1_i2.p1 TRINITY_DN16131_c0_g1~~TRINITY_DN16131_c0_g1_i2.p1  ORF type:complete len:157 (+),score=31.08 TRINITY_DN16131_c0_g1_i2:55-471(+)
MAEIRESRAREDNKLHDLQLKSGSLQEQNERKAELVKELTDENSKLRKENEKYVKLLVQYKTHYASKAQEVAEKDVEHRNEKVKKKRFGIFSRSKSSASGTPESHPANVHTSPSLLDLSEPPTPLHHPDEHSIDSMHH